MINKIKNFASLYHQLGFRWSAFRLAYAFRLRSGLIRLQTPQYKWESRPLKHWLKRAIPSEPDSYASWRKQNAPRFFPSLGADKEIPSSVSWKKDISVSLAGFFLQGMPLYFSRQLVHTGFLPDWNKDYFSEYVAFPPLNVSENKHWSQISDDTNGDIKFIWELNRFNFSYALVRAYIANKDEEFPEAFWTLIEDWAKHNPPNTGANWKDGQEISLRLMAWTFGYYAFLNSPSTTNLQISQFTIYVAAQAERIYKNIDYAISTKSNHTISEAFGLWMVGLLFPELKDSEKYFSLGKKILEEEASKQFFPDGSYSMYSLNYHRFVLHIYLYMIRLGELNQSPVSNLIYQKVESSINYLSQLIHPQTGQIPFYGSNDGALVLPLNNCDFTDFRPLLQLGSYITKKEFLFESGAWDEDIFWLCGESSLIPSPSPSGRRESESPSPFGRGVRGEGGVYILKNINSKAIIHCRDFKSRPSHADQLHVDLWIHGQNIACDAGTYLYSGEGIWRNGLAHTSAHNTVTVDNKDQMNMVSRFTWTNWSKGKVLENKENFWQGEHDGYQPVIHQRKVMSIEGDRWLVIDNLNANESHNYKLHWLLNDCKYGVQRLASAQSNDKPFDSILLIDSKIKMQLGVINGKEELSIVRADENSTRGWRSRYYGHKEPAISVMLETNQANTIFWTFFGFENDVVEINENILKVNDLEIKLASASHQH